jgi:hypothetical protein
MERQTEWSKGDGHSSRQPNNGHWISDSAILIVSFCAAEFHDIAEAGHRASTGRSREA